MKKDNIYEGNFSIDENGNFEMNGKGNLQKLVEVFSTCVGRAVGIAQGERLKEKSERHKNEWEK